MREQKGATPPPEPEIEGTGSDETVPRELRGPSHAAKVGKSATNEKTMLNKGGARAKATSARDVADGERTLDVKRGSKTNDGIMKKVEEGERELALAKEKNAIAADKATKIAAGESRQREGQQRQQQGLGQQRGRRRLTAAQIFKMEGRGGQRERFYSAESAEDRVSKTSASLRALQERKQQLMAKLQRLRRKRVQSLVDTVATAQKRKEEILEREEMIRRINFEKRRAQLEQEKERHLEEARVTKECVFLLLRCALPMPEEEMELIQIE